MEDSDKVFYQNKIRKCKFKLTADKITMQPSGSMKNHENFSDS